MAAPLRLHIDDGRSATRSEARPRALPVYGFISSGRDHGRLDVTAWAITTVLYERGVDIPEAAHTVITECDDLARLNAWLGRAATAHSF